MKTITILTHHLGIQGSILSMLDLQQHMQIYFMVLMLKIYLMLLEGLNALIHLMNLDC